METTSGLHDVDQVLTVIEDPEGELRPRTPGQADATGELVGAGASAVAALGAVGWMTGQGSDTARWRDVLKGPGIVRKVYERATGDRSIQEKQEERLREALRTYPDDRRGYIKVTPEEYPDVSHRRAARIAWWTGLRAETWGTRGSWCFGEKVVEQVPHD
ncbi:hypothetical protein [Streptomyces griseomycini]|uniref:Uncharacterized protein n=1 Tax=Streptomyces griseomycini TaxID=66895 RepID=A0A7W7LWI9_9ACTN|nr:hypothetical protein [Streptomyces griseomycini]MBB4897745.1 hypothetical protein [Streptomyces griseomycini]